MTYYLIDLERTIGSGMVYYWKANNRGYTNSLADAGVYSEENASKIVNDDFDKRTVMVSKNTVDRILE